MDSPKYKRLVLKLSGESFCEPGKGGIDSAKLKSVASKVIEICKLGPQVTVVTGAGNILRGEAFSQASDISRHTADYMGMLATIINSCAIQQALEKAGQPARVLSAIEIPALCKKFTRRSALNNLQKGRVVIAAGGTGNPFFTTDTSAALRAAEIDAELVIKATKVDGVYSDDPVKNPDADFFDQLSYEDILHKDLRIMDHSAISLCRNNNIRIIVLNIFRQGNLAKAVCGQQVGTLIS